MAGGIEKINLYAGRFVLDLGDLAQARSLDLEYIRNGLMCGQRSVMPPYEDPVTMAVNAANDMLTDDDRASIELLIVATESGVDFGKPLSTWVHRLCRLPPTCRSFEIKHACYGCTGALKMALSWIASGVRPGKKALVINTDLSRSGIGSPIEALGGACAIALLVSDRPAVLEIDPARAGYWTNEIADNLRPTATTEIVADYVSVFSYLDALDGAYEHFVESVHGVDYLAHFKKHIYHAPFPGMTLQAHGSMLGRLGTSDRKAVRADFEERVAGGLHFARRIGSAYGGSTFVGLLGQLQCATDLCPGDHISVFAYGGGCQGELYDGVVGHDAISRVQALHLDDRLEERLRISVQQYEAYERARDAGAERADYEPERDGWENAYQRQYAGRGLAVLKRVSEYRREYELS